MNKNSIIAKTRNIIERVEAENENLNMSILSLFFILLKFKGEEELDIEEEAIYVNGDPSDMFEGKLKTLFYDEDEGLCYVDTESEDEEGSSVASLHLATRIELANRLADMLEAIQFLKKL